MVERVKRELGSIDILVNNAGINIRKAPHILELEEWTSVIDTNLTSAFLCSKAVHPAMKRLAAARSSISARCCRSSARALRRPMPRARAASCSSPRLCVRLGRRQHPGQCDPAGLDRHRSHEARAVGGRRPARAGAGAHAGRTLGRDRRLRGDCGVPRLARVRLRHRRGDPGRRRLFDHGLSVRANKKPRRSRGFKSGRTLEISTSRRRGRRSDSSGQRGRCARGTGVGRVDCAGCNWGDEGRCRCAIQARLTVACPNRQ